MAQEEQKLDNAVPTSEPLEDEELLETTAQHLEDAADNDVEPLPETELAKEDVAESEAELIKEAMTVANTEFDAGAAASSTDERTEEVPFIRNRAPRATAEPIDDLAEDADASVHDSDFALGASAPLPVLGYRSARRDLPQLNRDLQFGKYLQVPKGHHAIFAKRERNRRIQSVLVLLAVVALLAAAAFVLWYFVQAFEL